VHQPDTERTVFVGFAHILRFLLIESSLQCPPF
jgi:hypothetical protein